MYEITTDNNQIEKIEKYTIGKPKIAPSTLKIRMNGILKIRNNAIDNTINFCSWRFFICLVNFYLRQSEKIITLLI